MAKEIVQTHASGKALVVAVKDLVANLEFNSRKTYHGIDELGADMLKNGQLSAILVSDRSDGKPGYEIVAGFRRWKAAKAVGMAELQAIYQPKLSEKQRLVRNIVENEGREDLSSYELADGITRLSGMGMSNPAIAAEILAARQRDAGNVAGSEKGKSLSVSYINNLIRARRQLSEEILEQWKKGNPKASLTFLFSVCGKPVDDAKDRDGNVKPGQASLWAEVMGRAKPGETTGGTTDATGGGTGGAGGTAGPTPPETKAPGKAKIAEVLAYIKSLDMSENDTSPAEQKIAIQTLEWVLGTGERIKGLFSEAAYTKAREVEKAAAKAAAAEKRAEAKKAGQA